MRDYQTKNGLTRKIYHAQRRSSERRGHKYPTYTKDELRAWIFAQDNFNALYNNWVSSSFKRDLAPSIDRINDEVGYSFDNIRLVSWFVNNKKAKDQIINGENTSRCLAVTQHDIYGNFIKEFHSLNSASRLTGVNLGNLGKVVRGEAKSAGGYIWRYKL